MSFARLARRSAMLTAIAALALSSVALPASAHALKGATKAEKVAHSDSHRAEINRDKAGRKRQADERRTDKKRQADERKAAKRAERLARFQVAGDVVAVDAETRTLQVAVVGGTKGYRGQTVEVVVAERARVNRDDARVAVSDILAGDHVAVKGRTTDGVHVADRVNASSPEPVEESVEEQPAEPEPIDDEDDS